METYFVDVILPLHLPDTYTYRVPQDYNDTIKVGQRVVVQFGAKKLYSALVRRIHQEAPKFTTKYVLAVIDIDPIVGERQFCLWEWMARYYMCGIGDVMAIALPSSLRIASESIVAIHPDFQGDLTNLSINEVKVVTLLSEHTTLSVADVSHALGIKQIMSLLNGMIERQIIIMDEDIKQRFNPRTATYISLAPEYRDSEKAKKLFDQMEKVQTKHKQLDALLYFMQMSHLGADTI
ncbi:MAG: hypothetical protein KBT04_06060, partial [Bacteroidales bacterium]|nr:hypothetical protein [Candidatus Colimorpha onthohippi]